jgi:amino acid permease
MQVYVSHWCADRLVADLGGTLYGPWMRYAILGSIVISQLGFVSAYTIFVSENLQARIDHFVFYPPA